MNRIVTFTVIAISVIAGALLTTTIITIPVYAGASATKVTVCIQYQGTFNPTNPVPEFHYIVSSDSGAKPDPSEFDVALSNCQDVRFSQVTSMGANYQITQSKNPNFIPPAIVGASCNQHGDDKYQAEGVIYPNQKQTCDFLQFIDN